MKISMGADHGGFALKEHIKNYLTQKGHEVVDMGTYSTDSCDYPDFGYAAAKNHRHLLHRHRNFHYGEQGQGCPLRPVQRAVFC